MGLDLSRGSRAHLAAILSNMSYLHFDTVDGKTTCGEALAQARRERHSSGSRTDYFADRFLQCAERGLEAVPRLGGFVADDDSRKLGYDPNGLRARTWRDPETDDLYVVFMGTGPGEWADNGVALSGRSAVNAYYTYDRRGRARSVTLREDGFSKQQAEAADYWARVRVRRRLPKRGAVVAAGHSKGGNKAQLLTLLFEEINLCYSFNGQGMSPEQIELLERDAETFAARREKIWSICGCDDFVNGLGDRVCSDALRVFLGNEGVTCTRDSHELYSMFGADGCLLPPAERGPNAMTFARMWRQARGSDERARVAMVITSAGNQILGNGLAINGETLSAADLLEGAVAAALLFLRSRKQGPTESENSASARPAPVETDAGDTLAASPQLLRNAAAQMEALLGRNRILAGELEDALPAGRLAAENRRLERNLKLVRRLAAELERSQKELARACRERSMKQNERQAKDLREIAKELEQAARALDEGGQGLSLELNATELRRSAARCRGIADGLIKLKTKGDKE